MRATHEQQLEDFLDDLDDLGVVPAVRAINRMRRRDPRTAAVLAEVDSFTDWVQGRKGTSAAGTRRDR